MTRVADLLECQLEEASLVLSRAFSNDPLFQYAWPDDLEREHLLPLYFSWCVRHGRLFGVVLAVGEPVAGLAIAFPPGVDPAYDSNRLAQSGYPSLRAAIGDAASARMEETFDVADGELRAAVREPHWSVDMLAVDPEHQGGGVGTQLLRAIHDRADADGVTSILLTFQPRSLRLYERHGYAVVAEGTEPLSGLSWWGLRRPRMR